MKPSRNFSLLVKPASFGCNLRCQYCFYLKKKQIFSGQHMMTDEVLRRMISSYMEMEMPVHSIGWQGGEPTLMGLDFFVRIVKYQQQFGKSGQQVSNGVQTNGTLLDDAMCSHFAKYNFLVGISVDGPAEMHNRYRLDSEGGGSHAAVMRGMECLKQNRVDFNVLTLVSDANVRHPLTVYNYLKELGVLFHQYIECVEFDAEGGLAPFAVRPGLWGEFLCTIFDEWYRNDTRQVSIRLFDSILTKLVDGITNVCVMGNDCRQYLVVEHNGNIYPCDFFVEPELLLGNIMNGQWNEFLESPIYAKFGARKNQLHQDCLNCSYLDLCAGCCVKNRWKRGNPPNELSVICEDWKMFYEHTIERFRQLADSIRRERAEAEYLQKQEMQNIAVAQRKQPTSPHKIGRNQPCPCGSGKKYKKCCGK